MSAAYYSDLQELGNGVSPRENLNYADLEVQALSQARRLFPNEFGIQAELGTAYSQRAKWHNQLGDLHEAVEDYRNAIALREAVLQHNPSDVMLRRNLMISYGNLGGTLGNPLYLNLGDSAGAQENYGKALAIARELAQADPNNQLAQYDLANALIYWAGLTLPEDLWPQALDNLNEAEKIFAKFVAAEPHSVSKLRLFALAQELKGQRLWVMGKKAEAIESYRKSAEHAEAAWKRAPSDMVVVTQVVNSEQMLSEALARQGDRDGAMERARLAIQQADQVKVAEGEVDRSYRLHANAYLNLGVVESIFSNWEAARDSAERSLGYWKRIVEMGSRRVEPSKMKAAEDLAKQSVAHLK